MMNMQNPALYPPQQAYAYGAGMAQPPHVPPPYPNDPAQNQFQQQQFPVTPQRPGQFPQPGNQIPPQIYQQLQQQQALQQQQQQQQHQQQHQQPGVGFGRPPSQGSGVGQGQRQSPGNGQVSNTERNTLSQPNSNQTTNMMGMAQQQAVNSANQQNQGQKSAVQIPQTTPLSPQSISREKARVTVLLEINSRLLQELVTLQNQGKAGAVQQSPTSPNSTNENFNSPVETSKSGPSKEFTECIRRLQANLSYLAAVADAKKRSDGKVPPHPAIITPPIYLTSIHESYKKLAMLFPEATQSANNKAAAFMNAQQHQQSNQKPGDAQMQHS